MSGPPLRAERAAAPFPQPSPRHPSRRVAAGAGWPLPRRHGLGVGREGRNLPPSPSVSEPEWPPKGVEHGPQHPRSLGSCSVGGASRHRRPAPPGRVRPGAGAERPLADGRNAFGHGGDDARPVLARTIVAHALPPRGPAGRGGRRGPAGGALPPARGDATLPTRRPEPGEGPPRPLGADRREPLRRPPGRGAPALPRLAGARSFPESWSAGTPLAPAAPPTEAAPSRRDRPVRPPPAPFGPGGRPREGPASR